MRVAERISVIGTGYVGLVSGTCFAEIGHQVVCVDQDAYKIDGLLRGEIPIYEPGLQALVTANLEAGRLDFTRDVGKAIQQSDIIMIAVGTPALPDGNVDMSQVRAVLHAIAAYALSSKIVVMKSTVPVGTGQWAENLLRNRAMPHLAFHVVSNPEFLREGSAIQDTFHPDRIVIGSQHREAGERIAAMHVPLGAEVLHTDRESAELIKYASNAFLAAKISFINEMAHVCEKVGANVSLVAKGMGMDRRIGPHFLNAGIGYGGSCFPKDTQAQLKLAQNVDYDFKILRAVIEVNQLQRQRFVAKIEEAAGPLAGKRIAVLGLAFKPNTDDLRDAPALDIIPELQARGASVQAYDPAALEQAKGKLPDVSMVPDLYAVVHEADAVVIVTEWPEFREMNWRLVRCLVNTPLIIDGRNMFELEVMRELGFTYVSVGRPIAYAEEAQSVSST